MVSLPKFRHDCSGDFQKIAAAFLGREGLPFADLVSAERICEVFDRLCFLAPLFPLDDLVPDFLPAVPMDP